MSLVLSFFIVIILFLILGLLFSKIKINVKDLSFKRAPKVISEKNYVIDIGLYLFGKVKILSINLQKDSIKIAGRKVESEYIKNKKLYDKIFKAGGRDIDKKIVIDNFKKTYINFEKFDLNVKLGTDSTLITSFLVFAVSTAVSVIIKKGVNKYNARKHGFVITPIYENYNLIDIDFKCIIALKTLNLIKIIADINRHSKHREASKTESLIKKKKHYPGYV